ncbi:MAG TPA: cytochrome c peroxidase [Pyrinomonadaceae bacterium]
MTRGRREKTGLAVALAFAVCALAAGAHSARGVAGARAVDFVPDLPEGISLKVWQAAVPPDNPLTAEKVALGRALYFDKRLSADGTVSCATCHDPATAFADQNPLAVGVAGRKGRRNAPTVLNAMFSRDLFWDGRARSLEEQAVEPLLDPSEMGMQTRAALLARVSAVPEYRRQFAKVFGARGLTVEAVAKAIAAFERTQLSGGAPFDRFVAGDEAAITDAQRRGWELFRGRARCAECHTFDASSPFFTDFRFHNTGVATKGTDFDGLVRRAAAGGRASAGRAGARGVSELGRFLTTGRPEDIGAFKTPTLRDVELTTPYMHDGSEKTLLDVVRFYNRGGERNPALDGRIRPLQLTDAEMNDLVEFMRALTSDDVLRQAQAARPQTRSPFTPEAGGQSHR